MEVMNSMYIRKKGCIISVMELEGNVNPADHKVNENNFFYVNRFVEQIYIYFFNVKRFFNVNRFVEQIYIFFFNVNRFFVNVSNQTD